MLVFQPDRISAVNKHTSSPWRRNIYQRKSERGVCLAPGWWRVHYCGGFGGGSSSIQIKDKAEFKANKQREGRWREQTKASGRERSVFKANAKNKSSAIIFCLNWSSFFFFGAQIRLKKQINISKINTFSFNYLKHRLFVHRPQLSLIIFYDLFIFTNRIKKFGKVLVYIIIKCNFIII